MERDRERYRERQREREKRQRERKRDVTMVIGISQLVKFIFPLFLKPFLFKFRITQNARLGQNMFQKTL